MYENELMTVAEWIIWLQKLGCEYIREWEKERGNDRNKEIGLAVIGYNTNSQAMGDALQICKIVLVIPLYPHPHPHPFTLSFCIQHSVSKPHSLPHKVTLCNNWLVKLITGLTNSGLNKWNVLSVNYEA